MLYMELMRQALSSIFCSGLEESKEGSSFFLKNGSKLLEDLVTQLNGRCNIPIRNFSAEEIVKATNNFDSRGLVCEDAFYRTYKGSFQKRQILVKKYHSYRQNGQGVDSLAVRDIAISSQLSFHKNALTLFGYCLDFEYPALVFQSPEANDDGCLFYTKELKLTWENRMSIAYDIANVLAYLHTGFSTPFIHRNIKLQDFVIDKHGTAKLADFSLYIPIPLGEGQVEDDVMGTRWRLDPIYMATRVIAEKANIYNVGVVLVELFTGKSPCDIVEYNGDFTSPYDFLGSYIERDEVENIVNDDIMLDGGTAQMEQLRAIAALALKCLEFERENRPEMVDVAKELGRIQRLSCSSSTSQPF